MTTAVLNASAVMALILDEPGRDQVRAVLEDAAITTVNLAEVVGQFARRGAAEVDIRFMIDSMRLARIVFDEELAYAAAMLLPLTKAAGLSLGDRACLALARRMEVKALTADRVWQEVGKSLGIAVEIIR